MKKIRQLLRAKKGTSMVEVMVAFLIIVLMVALFGKVVTLSMDIFQKSRSMTEKMEFFNAEYYKKDQQGEKTRISGELSLTEQKENQSEGVSIPLPQGKLKKYTQDTQGFTRYFIEIIPQTENGVEENENTGS